jgi:hypothetical protein
VIALKLNSIATKLHVEYEVGAGKKKYCKPGYLLGETGEYQVAPLLEDAQNNVLNIYTRLTAANILLALCIIIGFIVSHFAYIKNGLSTKNIPQIVMIVIVMIILITIFLAPISTATKVSRFGQTKPAFTIYASLVFAVGVYMVVSYITKQFDIENDGKATVLLMMYVLAASTLLAHHAYITQYNLKEAMNVYKTNSEKMKVAFDAIKTAAAAQTVGNLNNQFKASMLVNINASLKQQYTTTSVPGEYLDWKYIMNADGNELSGAFPNSITGLCTNNEFIDLRLRKEDSIRFTKALTVYACNISNDAVFRYQMSLHPSGKHIGTLSIIQHGSSQAITSKACGNLISLPNFPYILFTYENKKVVFRIDDGQYGRIVYIKPATDGTVDYSILNRVINSDSIEIGTLLTSQINIPYFTNVSMQLGSSARSVQITWTTNITTVPNVYIILAATRSGSESTAPEYSVAELRSSSYTYIGTLSGSYKVIAYMYHMSQSGKPANFDTSMGASSTTQKSAALSVAQLIGLEPPATAAAATATSVGTILDMYRPSPASITTS